MDDLVLVKVLAYVEGGHKDLVFRVEGLTQHLLFDTYYFGLAMAQSNPLNDVGEALAAYLSLWVNEISSMEDGGQRIFPIDLSDQYTGCLSIQRNGETVKLDYGHSRLTEGWSIDLNAPQRYFSGIPDFRTDTSTPLTVDRNFLVRSLLHQVEGLKGERPLLNTHH